MAKIKLSRFQYIPIITYVRKTYKLTWQQSGVYGFFFNHCQNLNDDGWCGYSDEYIAKELDLGVRTLQRELEILKSKNLITVKNPRKRTKRTGQSRMIYLNTEIFIENNPLEPVTPQSVAQDTEKDRKIAELEAEVKRLKAEQLERQMVYPSLYVQMLIDAKILQSEDIAYACATLDDAYNAIKAEFNANKVLEHIRYIKNRFKSKSFKKPDNVVKYLQMAATNYYYRLVSDQKYKEKLNISQKTNNTDDEEQLSLFDF